MEERKQARKKKPNLSIKFKNKHDNLTLGKVVSDSHPKVEFEDIFSKL
jgi:pullulanase/glycogen debranching enzyme